MPLPVLPPPLKYAMGTHILGLGSAAGQTQTKSLVFPGKLVKSVSF